MPVPIFQIDAFADQPFTGNPAAVVILDNERSPEWMQSVAAEMNLSETAFVQRIDHTRFSLRWFTPGMEVDLCGHATVATAFALWESNTVADRADLRFDSRSGELIVRSVDGDIELNFPLTPPQIVEPPAGLIECFRFNGQPITVSCCGRSRFDYLLEVSAEDIVRGLAVDFARLSACDCRGIIVTAKADNGTPHDFVSRFFAPAAGVNEDPVTGSAHCCLADFWAKKLGTTSLSGYQASKRGGTVRLQVKGDRVLLKGNAVMIYKGELLV